MKKLIVSIVFLSLFWTSCQSDDDNIIEPTPNTFSIYKNGSNNSSSIFISSNSTRSDSLHIVNVSNLSGSVSWVLDITEAASGWTNEVYIDNTLINGTTGTFTLDTNETKIIKFNTMLNRVIGIGKITLKILVDGEISRSIIIIQNQSKNFNFGLVTRTATDTVPLNTPRKEYPTKFKNISNNPLDMRWHIASNNSIPSWDIDVTDINGTHPPSVNGSSFTMPADSSFNFKVGINTNGTIGTDTITAYLYEPADSANTVKLYTVIHTVN